MSSSDNLFTGKPGNDGSSTGRGRGRGRGQRPPFISQQYRLNIGQPGGSTGGTPSGTPVSSGDNNSGRVIPNPSHPKCICLREKCVVTCKNLYCNWTGIARVHSLCALHPLVTYLMDLRQCPGCGAEVQEVPDRLAPIAFGKNRGDI